MRCPGSGRVASSEIGDRIREINDEVIPKVEHLFARAVEELGLDSRSEIQIRADVEGVLREIMARGLQLLDMYQAKAQQQFLRSLAGDPKDLEAVAGRILAEALKGGVSFTEQLTKLISESLTQFPPLNDFITSTSNMRMSRAGSMFHRAVRYVLGRCSLDSEGGGADIGRVDVVIPDRKTRELHPERTVLLELKAMHIRERAKSAKAEMEASKGPVWVVTLDDEFKDKSLADLEKIGLRVYCPKASERFPGRKGARPLNDLIPDIEGVVSVSRQRRLSTS